MKRRVYTTEGNEYVKQRAQVLVTYNTDEDLVHVAFRPDEWDTWSRPLTLVFTDDDPELVDGGRSYPTEGRSYVETICSPVEGDDEVTVTFTQAEAFRLYGSAASYESTVNRVVDSGAAALANSALTKLAAAMHPDVEQPDSSDRGPEIESPPQVDAGS